MLKNYLRIALRNIRRNKGYSFINIFGLALSLGLGLLIIQMIINLTSFDRFQANKERIFRLNTTRTAENEVRRFGTSPYPLASAVAEEVPGVEASTVWGSWVGGNAVCRGKMLPLWANFAGPDFFRVFSFRLKHGDPAAALREPYSIVLASKVAERFFGDDDPVGEVIRLGKWGDYTITGVLEDISRLKTHMNLGSIISLSTLVSLEKQKLLTPLSEDWTYVANAFSYVLLKPGVSPRQVEDAANRLAASHISDPKHRYRFWLQGLTDIVSGPKLENVQLAERVEMAVIYFLSAVGLLVVLSAAFNYTNLSIARALSRAREVGIRKVVGAKRRQLFAQFIGEAVVIALLALAAGFVLYRLVFIPLLLSLHPLLRTYFLFRETGRTLALFVIFAAGTGIMAGAIPALHISRFRPIQALRNLAGLRVVSRITARKALIVFQFGLSVVFVISALVSVDQIRLIRNTDLGFRTDGVLSVPLEGVDFQIFRQKISQEPGLIAISGVQRMPAVTGMWSSEVTRRDAPVTKPLIISAADAGFLSVFGLRLLAGANFPETAPPEGETLLILGETAARELEYGSPEHAVGQVLLMKSSSKNDPQRARIVGVVKDFVHGDIRREQGAFALSYRPEMFNLAAIRVDPAEIKAVAERLQRLWASFDSAAPFAYSVFTDQLEDRMAGAKIMMKSVRFVSFLAVVVSCLGLLGVADYSSRIRRREVGIRKVCGAGEWGLVKLLSRSYLGMLGVAAAAAFPVAWWFNGIILSVYKSERVVPLRPEIFAAGAVIVTVLGMAVVFSQTVRAARANPADIIRHE
ncbi:MAG: ABC transporter permease [Candidatus Aminicenantes bacterium]|nr:ABC transporter permease [Candidatus Aminicenantes bacterium]